MKGKELENYQSMSKIQKDFIDTLKSIGYEYAHNSQYSIYGENYNQIDVSKLTRWSGLLLNIYEWGKYAKQEEIKKVLNII
jgi:hypothetical protein